MLFIVDGNNLAGKLKILDKDEFSTRLRELLLASKYGKKSIMLVFDGHERMGDRQIIRENFEIRYSPKDEYYENADDYIVDLVRRRLKTKDITVVTDDRGLIGRLKAHSPEEGAEISIVSASEWARKLTEPDFKETEDDRGLNEDDADRISRDLLREWEDKI